MAKRFDIELDERWCKSCGLCVCVCPKDVLELSAEMKCVPARQDDCVGCGQCDRICPDLAITVKERG